MNNDKILINLLEEGKKELVITDDGGRVLPVIDFIKHLLRIGESLVSRDLVKRCKFEHNGRIKNDIINHLVNYSSMRGYFNKNNYNLSYGVPRTPINNQLFRTDLQVENFVEFLLIRAVVSGSLDAANLLDHWYKENTIPVWNGCMINTVLNKNERDNIITYRSSAGFEMAILPRFIKTLGVLQSSRLGALETHPSLSNAKSLPGSILSVRQTITPGFLLPNNTSNDIGSSVSNIKDSAFSWDEYLMCLSILLKRDIFWVNIFHAHYSLEFPWHYPPSITSRPDHLPKSFRFESVKINDLKEAMDLYWNILYTGSATQEKIWKAVKHLHKSYIYYDNPDAISNAIIKCMTSIFMKKNGNKVMRNIENGITSWEYSPLKNIDEKTPVEIAKSAWKIRSIREHPGEMLPFSDEEKVKIDRAGALCLQAIYSMLVTDFQSGDMNELIRFNFSAV